MSRLQTCTLKLSYTVYLLQDTTIKLPKILLDKKRVICKAVSPGDSDYTGMQVVVFTREPKGNTPNGSLKSEWLPWVKKIINVRERIVYKTVEVKPKRVITSQEELTEVLTQDTTGEHVVVQLPTSQAAVLGSVVSANHPSVHKP